MKICHVTSAHKRYDVRIFEKEATTLAKAGYKVSIIVNDQFADEIIDDIAIVSTGFKPKTRFERLFLSKKNIKEKINAVDADIYHLHDPELLTLVNYLKKKIKR